MFDHEFATEGLVLRGAGAEIVGDAAILALFVPAEASHGDVFGGEELHAAEEHVVLGNFEFSALDLYFDELCVGSEERAG